jgi:shikimate dehydrogenase
LSLDFELSRVARITPRVSGLFSQSIDATTRYCAVFGHPIKHSASPAMQNAGIAALGLNWRYLAFEVDPTNLREAIAGAKQMGFVGVNLTVPHKLLAMDMVDALDSSAKTWGAVNTIRFESSDEKTIAYGFNTDADAITRSLREDLGVELHGAKVLLLGAGGAGRTAALKLAAEGVGELHLVNRTESKAAAVAKEISERYSAVKVVVGYPKAEVDLLLNTTSLGLKTEDALPLDEAKFSLRQARAVYDMIYRPAETPLLKVAKAAGCRTANGLGMLLYQGAKALEIWSGKSAPVEIMRRALVENVYGH